MRIVVIGAGGQLGTDLLRQLPGRTVALDLPDFDITDESQVRGALRLHHPDWVINCAAATNVDRCEDEAVACFAINAAGALLAARCAAEVEAAIAYISTDYVFGAAGPRSTGYDEDDPPGPINTYGASKLAGEWLTLANNPRALIIRTCGLYGHAGARGKGGNFVETMLRLGRSRKPLQVVDDQRLSPTATVDCAAKILELLEADARGIVHVAARDTCTWFDFARAIFALADLPADLRPITSGAYGARARRPAFSALGGHRLAELGLEPCRSWREMLEDYIGQRPARRAAEENGASGTVVRAGHEWRVQPTHGSDQLRQRRDGEGAECRHAAVVASIPAEADQP